MEILFSDLSILVKKDISPSQAGLVLFIILLKELDPKMTLAKVRAKVKFTPQVKEDLIYLQDNHLIKWSGYKNAKKSLSNKKDIPIIKDIIDFMNGLYGRDFSTDPNSSTAEALRNRLLDYSAEEVKLVITNRYEEWKDDKVMQRYLHPSTIFRKSKFEKYIEEAQRTRRGEGLLTAHKGKLENDQELRIKDCKSLLDSDTYNVKIYTTDQGGEKQGIGVKRTLYGRDLKKLIRRAHRENLMYLYQSK